MARTQTHVEHRPQGQGRHLTSVVVQGDHVVTQPRGVLGWLRVNLATILASLVFVAGVGLIAYPSVSDWWNSFHQSKVVMTYVADVAEMSQEEKDAQLDSAFGYNRAVARDGVNWHHDEAQVQEYLSQLTSPNRTVMGYVSIDKIGVMLPIYHTTDESILATSIGHLEGSSLPVGAASYDERAARIEDATDGSHCVLSGHRGLPSARLFTDLDKLEEGDTFQLIVLDRVMTYEVDQVKVVEPEELGDLEVVAGRDLCTLVTCTPYGINTHRLLVRGTRVPTPEDAPIPAPEPAWYEPLLERWPLVVGALVAVIVLFVVLCARRRSRADSEPKVG